MQKFLFQLLNLPTYNNLKFLTSVFLGCLNQTESSWEGLIIFPFLPFRMYSLQLIKFETAAVTVNIKW